MNADERIDAMYDDAEQRMRRVMPDASDEVLVAGAATALAMDVLQLIACDAGSSEEVRALALTAMTRVVSVLESVNDVCADVVDAMEAAIARNNGGLQ